MQKLFNFLTIGAILITAFLGFGLFLFISGSPSFFSGGNIVPILLLFIAIVVIFFPWCSFVYYHVVLSKKENVSKVVILFSFINGLILTIGIIFYSLLAYIMFHPF